MKNQEKTQVIPEKQPNETNLALPKMILSFLRPKQKGNP